MLEPFCPMKHDLYITNIHISYQETVGRHASDINIYSLYKILCHILTTNNKKNFIPYMYINSSTNFQASFSRISADLIQLIYY